MPYFNFFLRNSKKGKCLGCSKCLICFAFNHFHQKNKTKTVVRTIDKGERGDSDQCDTRHGYVGGQANLNT